VALNEDLINEKGAAVALTLSSQSFDIVQLKLIMRQASGFIADSNPLLRHQVFDVTMTQVKSLIWPLGSLNDLREETVTLDRFL